MVSTAHATSAKVISLKLYLVFPSLYLPISLYFPIFLPFSLSFSSLFFISRNSFSIYLNPKHAHTHTHKMKTLISSEHEGHRRFAPGPSHLLRQGRRNVFSLLLTRAYHPSEHITPPSLSFSLSLSHTQQYTHNMPDSFFFIRLCFGCA